MHETFLQQALIEAWLGRGYTAPNPAVGAVAVQNEKVIAKAVTQAGVGGAHAEQKILDDLPEDCSDITLYVTLEPCNHWGKTPPCVDGIIKHQFRKVVYGYRDPNPLVQKNHTPALLAAHGIQAIHHPLPEIDAFYESYAHWVKTGRPFVTVKIAQSLDGKIAGKHNTRVQLSNQLCADFTHKARLYSDVMLTTTQTIIADNPYLSARVGNKVIAKPVAIIGQAVLDETLNIFKSAKNIHRYETNDLNAVLDDLGKKGYHDVWVEAGGKLFTSLHKAGLVGRTYIYVTPKVLGTDGIALYTSADLIESAKQVRLEPLEDNLKIELEWMD